MVPNYEIYAILLLGFVIITILIGLALGGAFFRSHRR